MTEASRERRFSDTVLSTVSPETRKSMETFGVSYSQLFRLCEHTSSWSPLSATRLRGLSH